jgi:hypothetical protein
MTIPAADAPIEVPDEIGRLAAELAASGGVIAVVVGGSQATGAADEHSDWDLGVYYRGEIALDRLQRWGEVHPPGSWGRLMNGGAWLQVGPARVDVLLRDVEAVEHWTAEAGAGRFAVDGLLGYVAGLPTYTLTAEVAIARPIHGSLDVETTFPGALAASAPPRWRFCRDFSLTHARSHAARGNVAGALGQAARALFEEAHARVCEQRRWVLNEKRLLTHAGLDEAGALLWETGSTVAELEQLVGRLAGVLASAGDQSTATAPLAATE